MHCKCIQLQYTNNINHIKASTCILDVFENIRIILIIYQYVIFCLPTKNSKWQYAIQHNPRLIINIRTSARSIFYLLLIYYVPTTPILLHSPYLSKLLLLILNILGMIRVVKVSSLACSFSCLSDSVLEQVLSCI